MLTRPVRTVRGSLALALALSLMAVFLTSCTVRLAPAYDENIEKGISDLHKSVSTFFETLIVKPSEAAYSNHEQFYIDTLATARNIQLRARSRPQPKSFLTSIFGLEDRPLKKPSKDENICDAQTNNESAQMICRLIKSLEDMRETHETMSLREPVIDDLRPLIDSQFGSILEYEMFLKRD